MSANPPRKGDPIGAGLRLQRYNNFLRWQSVWETFFEKSCGVGGFQGNAQKKADLNLRFFV